MLSAKNINDGSIEFDGRLIQPAAFAVEDRRTRVQPGDVLLTIVGSIGRAAVVRDGQPRFTLQRSVAVLKPCLLDARFLMHQLQAPHVQRVLDTEARGTAQKGIYLKSLGQVQLRICGSAEQCRIADVLDELLADLDAGVAALERVREKLKLYRASVLIAAVEGAITAEWRAHHPDTEPAAELLQRILVERRHRWEEDQLAKFKAKGQESPKNWKAKYKEPVVPDPGNLPLLPEGWCFVAFDQVVWSLRSGSAETSSRDETAYPVLKSSAVRHGAIEFGDLNYLQKSQSSRPENFLRRGDFLITRLSGSVDYVGCSAVVKELACEGIQYPDRIFCGRLVAGAEGTYVSYCFQHSRVRKAIEAAAKSTAGHQRISMSDLRPLVVALPPLAEQEAIVEAVEDQLSVIDHLEGDLGAKLESAQALRQAILRHAFAGRLVPQDPNDEPASELLKRIAAEREGRARAAAAARRAGKPPAKGRPRRARSA